MISASIYIPDRDYIEAKELALSGNWKPVKLESLKLSKKEWRKELNKLSIFPDELINGQRFK